MKRKKKRNVWKENLQHALEWEQKLRPKLEKSLHSSNILRMFFSRIGRPESLSSDAEIQFLHPQVDFKVRRPKYYRRNLDILIELKTGDKMGWFYTTDSILYYAWERYAMKEPCHNCLINGFFINIPKLRNRNPEWIKRMIATYYREGTNSISEDESRQWSTRNIFVPVKEFPKDLILRFNLDTEVAKEQTKINSFKEERSSAEKKDQWNHYEKV